MANETEYTFYQLRTLKGDGDVAFFVECEAFSLQEIQDWLDDNELNAEDFVIFEIEWKEREVNL